MMKARLLLRKLVVASILVFLSTFATLLCRQFDIGPARPSPDFRAFGAKDAKIQIYEYTDFSCPACKAANAHIKDLLRVYKDSIRLNFKHYPLLSIHPWSLEAAAYGDCAGKQGKFTEYADLLFDGQDDWAFAKEKPRQFLEYAKKLNLDLPAMEKCSQDEEVLRQLRLDISEGDTKGVNATPTFFVNGKRAVGAAQLIEQEKRFDAILGKK